MRRLLSIALLLALGLPLFAAVFGSAQAESTLPMCCRRAGLHHCAGMGAGMGAEMPGAQDKPVVRMACTSYPHSLGQMHNGGWIFTAVRPASALEQIEPSRVRQAEAGYRIAQSRASHQRGPPCTHDA